MLKILVLGPTYLGDIIFTTPAVRAIRLHFPDAHIAYCIKNKYSFPILEGNPDVDRIILYGKNGRFTPFEKFRLIRKLKKHRFDMAFTFTRDFERSLIPFFSGIKIRIGYYTPRMQKYRKFFVFKPIFTFAQEELGRERFHCAAYHLDFINRYLGKKYDVRNYVVGVPDSAQKSCGKILEGLKSFAPVICLHAPAGTRGKQWPPAYFAELGNLILKRFPGCKIVLPGSKEEIKTAREVADSLNAEPVFLAGKTTLNELGAILKRCDLMVAGDTGPMHFACGLKVPVIALFGETSHVMFGPYGETRAVTIQEDSMKDIKPERVMEKVIEILTG